MDIEEARQFLRENHNVVLCTIRKNGEPALTPVTAGVDDEGYAVISSRETAYKVQHLRRDPRAWLCVLNPRFYGEWVLVQGTATIVSLPEAMEMLVDYYRGIAGEHPDWDDYRRARERDQRVIIRVAIERAGPDRHG